MKQFIRVIGIDDGYFKPKSKTQTALIGVVFRADNRVEGILAEKISVDGLNSTEKLIKMIKKSKFLGQISFIILAGVNFAGFNIVDLEKLHRRLRLPVIIVFRRKPNFEKIKLALRKFRDSKKRYSLIEKAGPIHKTSKIFFQCYGCDAKIARQVLRKCEHFSNLPEPVRLAHLIASGITRGQSTHP